MSESHFAAGQFGSDDVVATAGKEHLHLDGYYSDDDRGGSSARLTYQQAMDFGVWLCAQAAARGIKPSRLRTER